jgi:hypothetical protein
MLQPERLRKLLGGLDVKHLVKIVRVQIRVACSWPAIVFMSPTQMNICNLSI